MIKYFRTQCHILLIVILFLASELIAGSEQRSGTAGAQELLIPVGSRGTALNGAFISGIDGIESIYWNPAGLATNSHTVQAMFSHQNYLVDMNVSYGALAINFDKIGALGVSIKSLDFGAGIEETTVENPNGTGRTFSPVYLTFGLTYARYMADRIKFGATLKFISENIINTTAFGYAFDFGVQYKTGYKGLTFGITLKNFGPKMVFSGSELEHNVQIPGTEAGVDQERLRIQSAAFDLPTQFELGLAYLVNFNEHNSLNVMAAFQNNSFSSDTYNIAAEYTFNNWVFLRASQSLAFREDIDGNNGGFTSSNEDYLYGPAFGGGVLLNLGESSVMNIDYAFRTAAIFSGNIHWFTITFGL